MLLPTLQISTLIDGATRVGRMGFVPHGVGGGDTGWTLRKLFQGIDCTKVQIPVDQPVRALITDSRRVVPGAVFFARDGTRTDGFHYAEEAIDRGAVAVVSTRPPGIVRNVAQIQVEDSAVALATVSRKFYGYPDRELSLIGITGTNGKTTVSWILQQLLTGAGLSTGLIGTVHYDIGGRTIPSYRTTPESVDSLSMLKQMGERGCRAAVMEVSSHGIHQHRTAGFEFDCAVFLNLTRDHLDYHRTMEDYFEVKSRLFNGGIGWVPPVKVIHRDDPWGRKLIADLGDATGLVTFGCSEEADIGAVDPVFEPDGTRFGLRIREATFPVRFRLPGRYNLSNALAAAAAANVAGLEAEKIVAGLEAFRSVPGRMEPVYAGQKANVFVDYAHTDDALNNALAMLREVTPGRLLTVFGCGGDRDRTKRPKMMTAVQRHSDLAWATADNPRNEALEQIFDDMREGITEPSRVRFVADRRTAISEALDFAREGDTLLIAGKGHETYQEFQDTVVPFDDRAVAKELIEQKKGGGDA